MDDYGYFVVLQTQGGGITPMTDEDGEMAFFHTRALARCAAKTNLLAEHFGYQIFANGEGSN